MICNNSPFRVPSCQQNQWCSVFSLLLRMMCIMNVLHKVRLLISISTDKFWNISMMQYIVNSCKCGKIASDKLTMTMHLPTHPSLCGNFWLNTIFHKSDSPATHQIWLPLPFLCSLNFIKCWKEENLMIWKQHILQWTSCCSFQELGLKGASSTGRNGGICVCG